MTLTVLIILVVFTLAMTLVMIRAVPGVRTFFEYRGKRIVTCPETQKPAAVNVAAGEAAVGAFLSEPTLQLALRLKECSRWPERQSCGQECLQQIEMDPEKCLVWNIVSKWYTEKKCVFCHKVIGALGAMDHAPALLGPDFKTREWKDIYPEQLPEILATHQPVCWNCHVAETFRRLHPEMVVDREPDQKRITKIS